MKTEKHIEALLKETHNIQMHGHCVGNPAAFVAVNDVEIAIDDLRKAFEEKINDGKDKR